MKSRTFVDTVILHAMGGNGGNGCVGFRREKYVPRGGPDGGDGGHGGDVILRGDHDITSLEHIFFTPHQRGQHAGHGRGKKLHGRNGQSCVVPVPCGTEVRDPETQDLLADIVEHGQEFVAASGGKGGLGNCHWKTSTHQAPTEHTDGELGAEVDLRLTLKLISNVGLVGFPNAGKSSILQCVSDAHPKVAAYPFTTLHPIIGTLIYDDYTRVTVADIPGLIKGAHDGVGLGHAFLRHIERAQCLAYVLDMAGVDGRSPIDDYLNLREELALHRADLVERPALVVANKMDLPAASDHLAAFVSQTGLDPIRVSAATGDGVDTLKLAIRELTRP